LVFLAIAVNLVFYVETHPGLAGSTWIAQYFLVPSDAAYGSSADGGSADCSAAPAAGIWDVGFLVTTPLHTLLDGSYKLNDAMAGANSLFLFMSLPYVLKTTFWEADYTLGFRMVATQMFRSWCGFFTFLPPSREFLPSYWDYPEAIYCVLGTVDCSVPPDKATPLPFVTFFSGHVAMAVIIGNHMYTRGHRLQGVAMHAINVFQIVRLLATRGHYSIDLIIGWVVAVYVSNPAERLGRYFSRGEPEDLDAYRHAFPAFPAFTEVTATKLFEMVAGVNDVKLGSGFTSHDNLTSMQGVSTAKLAKKFLAENTRDARESVLRKMREVERDFEMWGEEEVGQLKTLLERVQEKVK
jgi:hypothetical protein